MKKCFLLLLFIKLDFFAIAQQNNASSNYVKAKYIKYNAFGMGAMPYKDLMFGGNHIFYRKIGFCISYRAGIRDLLEPKYISDIPYAKLVQSQINTSTGNTLSTYAFSVVPGFAYALTKKIPIYGGVGIVKNRHYSEFINTIDSSTAWAENTNLSNLQLTFTAGIFIPLFWRVVLNVAYDHAPQTVFIGLTIRSWDAYEDLDLY